MPKSSRRLSSKSSRRLSSKSSRRLSSKSSRRLSSKSSRRLSSKSSRRLSSPEATVVRCLPQRCSFRVIPGHIWSNPRFDQQEKPDVREQQACSERGMGLAQWTPCRRSQSERASFGEQVAEESWDVTHEKRIFGMLVHCIATWSRTTHSTPWSPSPVDIASCRCRSYAEARLFRRPPSRLAVWASDLSVSLAILSWTPVWASDLSAFSRVLHTTPRGSI